MPEATKPDKGVLLLAAASLPDPNFDHTVVLLCEHEDEIGSFGLVLNHLTKARMSDLFEGAMQWDAPIYRGGPVQLDSIHFLHGGLEQDPDAVAVADGVYWGRDFVAVVEALERGLVDSDSLRFFVGYSGWGEFQLNAELSEESWYMAHATAELVFAGDLKNQWRDAFRTLGPDYAVLANFPDDCMLN